MIIVATGLSPRALPDRGSAFADQPPPDPLSTIWRDSIAITLKST